VDPFPATSNPNAYLPLPAWEVARRTLREALISGHQVCALTGPTGLGKTMLLRVLEVDLKASHRCVYFPYAALEPADLVRWAHGLLDVPWQADGDPEAQLARLAQPEDDDRPLLLLMDDASALPPETARWLVACCGRLTRLSLLIVPVDDCRSHRIVAALGLDALEVRLATPLTREDTDAYVHVRLRHAGVSDEVRARFSARAVSWLHRTTGGNPRAIHALAAWMTNREGPVPEALAAAPLTPDDPLWLEIGGHPRQMVTPAPAPAPASTRSHEASPVPRRRATDVPKPISAPAGPPAPERAAELPASSQYVWLLGLAVAVGAAAGFILSYSW